MPNPNARHSKKVLELKDLTVSYGKISALKSISLFVGEGEIVSLLGANGAGKTTTLNAISGVVPINAGEIIFSDKSIVGLAPHVITRTGIFHVPEGRRIFSELTVEENLRAAAYIYERFNRNKLNERRDYVYSLFPILYERKTQPAGNLSGGEQQMLAIGRAIVTGGEVLLLDEPSMGLAPLIVEKIFSVIKEIADNGQTILLVEQNAMKAMEIAEFCYVLQTGSVVYEGTPAELKTHNEIAKAYLG